MNKKLIEDIIKMEREDEIMRALNDRRTYILTAIGERVVEPTDAIMLELAELNIALGDFPAFEDGE